MLTTDTAIEAIISDEPFAQTDPRAAGSLAGRPSRRRLSLGRANQTSGARPPMSSATTVAQAAPVTPRPRTPTSRRSRTTLARPAAIVTRSPSRGLPAVEAKVWKAYCSMNAGRETIEIRPYRTHNSSSSPEAPSASATGRMRTAPTTASTMPAASVAWMIIEK